MLKLRLQRTGRKKKPSYRVVVIEHKRRRDGSPVEYLGYYNPLSKEYNFNVEKIKKWLSCGAKPSPTVYSLFSKSKIINN